MGLNSMNVVSGRRRDVVGSIYPQEGLRTSVGRIARITATTVIFEDGTRRRNLDDVTVKLSDTTKFRFANNPTSQPATLAQQAW
jgi:hypothetical protein